MPKRRGLHNGHECALELFIAARRKSAEEHGSVTQRLGWRWDRLLLRLGRA